MKSLINYTKKLFGKMKAEMSLLIVILGLGLAADI